MEKTEHEGIYRLDDGRFKIDTNAVCPKTRKLKRRRKTMPMGTTLAGAIRERDAIKATIHGEPQPKTSRLTLAAYADRWLQRKAARLKPNTHATYSQILADVIIPQLGTLYADVIVRADVEEWCVWAQNLRQPTGEAYSDATLLKWWRTLTVLLKDLAADIDIKDPTRRVDRPTSRLKNVREKQTLTAKELGAFLDAAQLVCEARYAELITLAYSGLRIAELYALQWGDVDAERGVLLVQRTISKGQLTDTTKTGDSRVVAVPELVIETLQAHRTEMIRGQHRGLSSGLIFPSNAGTPRTNSSLTKPVRAAAKAAKLDIIPSPQVLRRTYNTLMLREGVNETVLRSQMGHCSQAMTARYMGVSDEDKHAIHRKVFKIGGVE